MQKKSQPTHRRDTKAIEKLVASADGSPLSRDMEAIASIYGIDNCEDIYEKIRSRKTREAFWRRIEKLKILERRCPKSRGRKWLYRFLDGIYNFRRSLDDWEEGELGWSFVKRHTLPQHGASYDIFRILIDIASTADEKSRSRWVQALRYAYDQRKYWRSDKSLKQFFVENGGVSGCARKIAEPRKKKRIKRIRIWA